MKAPRMDTEHYRQIAADCVRMASEARNPAFRAKLIDMAASWLKLAGQAERNSRSDLVYGAPPTRDDQRSVQ